MTPPFGWHRRSGLDAADLAPYLRVDAPNRTVHIVRDVDEDTYAQLFHLLCIHLGEVGRAHGSLPETPAWFLVHAAGRGHAMDLGGWEALRSDGAGEDLPADAQPAHERLARMLGDGDPDAATPAIGAALAGLWLAGDAVLSGRLRHAVTRLSTHVSRHLGLAEPAQRLAAQIWRDAPPGEPVAQDPPLDAALPDLADGRGLELGWCTAGIDTLSKHVTFRHRLVPGDGSPGRLRSTFVLHLTADVLIRVTRVDAPTGSLLRRRLMTVTDPAGGPLPLLGSWVRDENPNLPDVEVDGRVFERWVECGGRAEQFEDIPYALGLADLVTVLGAHAVWGAGPADHVLRLALRRLVSGDELGPRTGHDEGQRVAAQCWALVF